MKKVIAACIDRVLEFDRQEEAAAYIEKIRTDKKHFTVINRTEHEGKYRIRIKEQYNNSPLLDK